MAITNIARGALAKSTDVQQIIDWLKGSSSTNVAAVSLVTWSSATAYTMTLQNTDVTATGGKALRVLDSLGTHTLLSAEDTGVVVAPHGNTQSIFKVLRDDGTTAFEVSSTGVGTSTVSTGAETFITTSSTSTLTNKTLTTAVLNGNIINDYIDIVQTASAPANPSSGRLRLYVLQASEELRFRDNASVEKVIVDTNSNQTLTTKTLTAPAISNPDITGRVGIALGTEPGTPSGVAYIYAITGQTDLRYKANSATERVIVDTTSTQTLSGKTFGAGLALTTPALTGPTANYIDMDIVSSPGSDALRARLFAKNDNNLYYRPPGGSTDILIFTPTNSATLATTGFARGMALGGL